MCACVLQLCTSFLSACRAFIVCSSIFSPAQLRPKVWEENINYVRVTSDQRLFPDITFTCNAWRHHQVIMGAEFIEVNSFNISQNLAILKNTKNRKKPVSFHCALSLNVQLAIVPSHCIFSVLISFPTSCFFGKARCFSPSPFHM